MTDQVLFLCTGNTCRSPLAEVMARSLCGGTRVIFGSVGLEAKPGCPASRESVAEAAGRGLDLSGHRSRPVTANLLQQTAWVIGMTRSHAAIFRSRYGAQFDGKIGILGLPGHDLSAGGFSPEAEEIDDPYGAGPTHYAAAAVQIERLLHRWRDVFMNPEGLAP